MRNTGGWRQNQQCATTKKRDIQTETVQKDKVKRVIQKNREGGGVVNKKVV